MVRDAYMQQWGTYLFWLICDFDKQLPKCLACQQISSRLLNPLNSERILLMDQDLQFLG